MKYENVIVVLDTALPDTIVTRDVRRVLADGAASDMAEIEINEKWISVPIDTRIDIITKAVFKEYVEMPFGAYKAQVAIGGVKKLTDKERLHQAVYCFATLYYSEEGQMTTIDFHSQVR